MASSIERTNFSKSSYLTLAHTSPSADRMTKRFFRLSKGVRYLRCLSVMRLSEGALCCWLHPADRSELLGEFGAGANDVVQAGRTRRLPERSASEVQVLPPSASVRALEILAQTRGRASGA